MSASQAALIDSHCHLDFPAFDDDRQQILTACREKNIQAIIVPGVCRKDWQRLLTVCQQQSMLFPALGLHPCFMAEHQQGDLDVLAEICAAQTLTAIGEIGLDFYIDNAQRDLQQHFFSEQLHIAAEYNLPVLIHARKSHDALIRQLKSNTSVQGIIHAFSGSYEQAKEYLKRGFKLGFGGSFTYPRATKLRALLSRLPPDVWVLETDAPDMSPFKYHGQRNSPHYLTEIAQVFVQLYKAQSIYNEQQLLTQLLENTLQVLPSVNLKS